MDIQPNIPLGDPDGMGEGQLPIGLLRAMDAGPPSTCSPPTFRGLSILRNLQAQFLRLGVQLTVQRKKAVSPCFLK